MVTYHSFKTTLCITSTSLALSSLSSASLIAFFEFNNASDLGLDSGPGAITATNNGGVTFNPNGFSGGAASFNGNNNIQVPINVNPGTLTNFTWGAWLMPTTANNRQTVLSHDNAGFDRTITIDNRSNGSTPAIATFTGSGVLNSGVVPSTTTWTFVAASYDQSTQQVKFFVDDNAAISSSTTFGGGNPFFQIGNNPDFNEGFTGLIDNVFVFDETLSDSEISQLRASGGPATIPEPSSTLLSGVCLGTALLIRRRNQRA